MNEDGALFDSGFDDTGPFRVSPESGGVSLESALRDFGPAAIDDLIPRLRTLAETLDRAHRAGIVHGALHPNKVFVTDAATELVAGKGTPFDSAQGKHAYVAPEVLDGHGATPQSDQYALAAIAYEWLFGRPIAHNGERPLEVRLMPGVDRSALSKAFTRALAPKPDDRFASCAAFCDAMNGAVVPELPLLADVEDFAAEEDEEIAAAPVAVAAAPDVDDVTSAESFDADREGAVVAEDKEPFDTIDSFDSRRVDASLAQDKPRLSEPAVPEAVAAWNPAASTPEPRRMETPSFGPMALFLAVIVGAIFGFAAGYMARPRALQSQPPQTFATATGTADDIARRETPEPKATEGSAPKAPAPKALAAPKAPETPKASKAPEKIGRLLVRSSPSGASVTVDGVARGETPLALRDLDPGTRTVVVARRGYVSETRRILISKARPARTLDVRLASESAAAAPKPSTPATIGKPAVTTGTLSVDSRPVGAAVTINGTSRGTTPLMLDDLAPGEYRILMAMPGYRNFTTTVRVVAGERVRAAASLTALEQE